MERSGCIIPPNAHICLLKAFSCNNSGVSQAATSEMVRRAIKAYSLLLCHLHSLKKILQGAAVNIVAPWPPMRRVFKKDSSYRPLFHRGHSCEYTLRAECSGEGKIHKIVPGAEFIHLNNN